MRRIQYEDEVSQDGRNYDVWFDCVWLEEGALRTLQEEGGAKEEEDAAMERTRDVYECAVAHVPPGQEKRHWRQYIFLWPEYALFEEIETKVFSSQYAPLVHSNVILQDRDCACQAYRTVLNLEQHKQFMYSRVTSCRIESSPKFLRTQLACKLVFRLSTCEPGQSS
jgi:crooked neck